MHRVIGGDQLRDVHQILIGSGLPRTRIDHAVILTRQAGHNRSSRARVCPGAPVSRRFRLAWQASATQR